MEIDHELADVASSIPFLLDVTPINLVDARTDFLSVGTAPDFVYAPLRYDPASIDIRLEAIDLDTVEDTTLARIVAAKRRELQLQPRVLRCRRSAEFRALSVQPFGPVGPGLLGEAKRCSRRCPLLRPREGLSRRTDLRSLGRGRA